MKYRIPGTYYDEFDNLPIVTHWKNTKNTGKTFRDLLKEKSGSDRVSGNWEDGWTVEFDDEARYTLFLLKWSTS